MIIRLMFVNAFLEKSQLHILSDFGICELRNNIYKI